MIKSIVMVFLLPLWIGVTILSPIMCHYYWVPNDKALGTYSSFWKTLRNNVVDIWLADYSDIF